MRITEAVFVVVDTETTGLHPARDRLIEIAAVRIAGGAATERFNELVNPQRAIPGSITRLTGITNEMVSPCASSQEVLPQFLEFLGDAVLVAHNLNFDLRFLNAELSSAGMQQLACPTICTLRLARRLLPGLRSKSLRNLTHFYKIVNRQAHRALADAEATAGVFSRMADVLRTEHHLEWLDDLLRFQHKTYQTAIRSKHLAQIRRTTLPRLPGRPGVYFLKDASGMCLYVGKARNLNARVSSYFSAIEGHEPRIRRMMDYVRSVEWRETPSELEAMLLESRLIKKIRPRYNRAQLEYRVRPFLRLEEGPPPALSITPVLKDDGALYFGPFESRSQVRRVKRVIDLFFQPIERERVVAFLAGQDDSVPATISSAMRRAAEATRYEAAAELRDLSAMISRALGRDDCIAPAVLDQNAVLVLADDERHRADVHFVRFGRLIGSLATDAPEGRGLQRQLRECIRLYAGNGSVSPERYYVEEAEEVRIIRQWAHANRHRLESIRWEPDEAEDALSERVRNAIHRALEAGPEEMPSPPGADWDPAEASSSFHSTSSRS